MPPACPVECLHFVINVPVEPAGAIRGRVWNPDGSPGATCHVQLFLQGPKQGGTRNCSNPPKGQFLFGSMPLENKYRLVAHIFRTGWGP